MTINYVGLNYKAYYSAHFHHHANLCVINIFGLSSSSFTSLQQNDYMTSSAPDWLVSSIGEKKYLSSKKNTSH